MTPVDPARREARGAPSIAAAMTGLWLVAWVGWVLYRHAQPGGATIEWIVAGAFGVGPAVARVAAWWMVG